MSNKPLTIYKKLGELSKGDKFYPASKVDKTTPIFQLIEDPNPSVKTILCRNLQSGGTVLKSSSLEVVRTGTNFQ